MEPRQYHVQCLSPWVFTAWPMWSGAMRTIPGAAVCARVDAHGPRFRPAGACDGRSLSRRLPDVVGRGFSDWLRDPAFYGIPQYASDMAALIARLDVEQVDWVVPQWAA